MGRRQQGAIDAAERYVRQTIVGCPCGTRLPPLKQLARAAGVGLETMWKAVQRLKHEGSLNAAPHRGIRVVDPPDNPSAVRASPAPHTEPSLASERVSQLLRRQILEGRFRRGEPLPSMKELCVSLGTCHRTLARALQELAQQRLVVRHRRGYAVAGGPRSHGANRVLIVAARGCLVQHGVEYYRRTATFIKRVEQECVRQNLRAEYVLHSYHARDIRTLLERLVDREGILGALVFTTGTAQEAVGELLRAVQALGKPMSALDEHGWLSTIRGATVRRNSRLFTLAGEGAGTAVGTYLLGRGHDHVAFVSAHGNDPWSRARLAGVRRAYEQAGIADGVLDCSFSTLAGMAEDDSPHHRVRQDRSPAVYGLAGRLVTAACRTFGEPGHRASEEETRAVLHLLGTQLNRTQRISQLSTHVRETLGDRSVTALIASNDVLALECTEVLRGLQVPVPDRVSLVSFDDTLAALSNGLSSYNFRTDAVLDGMLNSVLASRFRTLWPGGRAIELEGFVAERRSTARRADLPPR